MLKIFTFAKFHVVYIWKVVVCTAKLSYFRCSLVYIFLVIIYTSILYFRYSPDVISTASSGLLPIDVPKIRVQHIHCSRDVEICRVQQMVVNFTSFCRIVAYILKVVLSMTISCRKYDFYEVEVQKILVYHQLS